MTATITFSPNTAMAQIEKDTEIKVSELKTKLDSCFRNKIKTPEQVIDIYHMLEQYKYFSGEEYKITFEENTIV